MYQNECSYSHFPCLRRANKGYDHGFDVLTNISLDSESDAGLSCRHSVATGLLSACWKSGKKLNSFRGTTAQMVLGRAL